MVARVLLLHEARTALVRAMEQAAPGEAVGVLGGRQTATGCEVARFVALASTSATDGSFALCEVAFARAEAELRDGGFDWLGFAHSHPTGSAQPSLRDRRELWRDCLHLIIAPGIETASPAPQLVAFRLQHDVVVPLALEVV